MTAWSGVLSDALSRPEVVSKGRRQISGRAANASLRRRAIRSLGCAAFVLATAAQAQDNWAGFRGNPQMTGIAKSDLPERPELLWTFKTGDAVESTTALVNGVVYVGSLDGFLYAVNLDSGKEKWRFKADGAVKSSPTVHNGIVYFGDSEGVFHAVIAATGKEKWRYVTEGEIISCAAVVGDRVIFGSYDENLYGLSLADGSEKWKVQTEGYVHGSPATARGSVVVAGCDGFLRAINPSDGVERLKIKLDDYVGASAAVFGNRVYVATFGSQAMAVDLDTRAVVWRYRHSQRQFPFYASAAITPSVVLFAGRDKMIHALDPSNGKPKWAVSVGAKVDSSPVIVGNRICIGTDDGRILLLNLADGGKMWQYETGSAIVASPCVASRKLIIGSTNGVVYCFGRKTNP